MPPASNAELGEKYGPGSQAAKDGKQQYFVNPTLSFRYLALNTTRPLFETRSCARRSTTRSTGRRSLIQRGAFAGHRPTSTCRRASRARGRRPLPARRARCREGEGAGRRRARDTRRPVHVQRVAVPGAGAAIMQQNLKAIGIDVEVKQFDARVQFSKEGTKGEPFDIAVRGLACRLHRPVRLHQHPARRPDDPERQQRQLLLLQRPGLQQR